MREKLEGFVEKLCSWLREEVEGGGGRGAVVGMSGGLDSSVVAVLCRRAFGDEMLGVIMPCFSNPEDVKHARMVAEKFRIPTITVVLDEAFEVLRRALPEIPADEERRRVAEANLKPRLRMIVLYYLANILGYLVVGTGNRSEREVGYFTKYGDGGVDLLPLGGLVKTQVRELARYLGIPEEIIAKPPPAGLWEGQTDEGEMGLTYRELDRYLLTGEGREEIRRKIEEMRRKSEHKRRLPPIPPFDFPT